MKTSAFALGWGVMVLFAGPAMADPAAPPAPAPVVQPVSTEAAPVAPKSDPAPEKEVKVCHYEEVSGSMIKKRVCR